MKIWQRICSILLSGVLIFVVLTTVKGMFTQPVPCCLCNATRYHAPCLVDLETGSVTELSVYDPHPTITGELAEEQYTSGTFSFVTCGEAQGYRDTAQKKIEIAVPDTELTEDSLLCNECKMRYSIDSEKRYILADLYEKEKIQCVSMVEQVFYIRCYEVIIRNHESEFVIRINGTMADE